MMPVANIHIWTPESLMISMSLSHLENLQIKWRTLPSTIWLFLTIIWEHVLLSNEIMMSLVLKNKKMEQYQGNDDQVGQSVSVNIQRRFPGAAQSWNSGLAIFPCF